MKLFTAALLTILAGSAWAIDADKTNVVADALYGRWNSIEIGGKDAGDQIMALSYEFRSDGTITITGEIRGQGSTSYSGTYNTSEDSLYIDFGGNVGSNTMEYSIGTNSFLTISEPRKDAWVRCKKESAEQPGPGYPPQGVGSPDP